MHGILNCTAHVGIIFHTAFKRRGRFVNALFLCCYTLTGAIF